MMIETSNFKLQKPNNKAQELNTKEQTSNSKGQNPKFKLQTAKNKDQTLDGKSQPFDLEERTIKFSEDVILFCKNAQADHVTRPLISQLVRSATSIGANLAEANNAVSKKDFRNKAYISKKEAQETKYWLRILKSSYTEDIEQLETLWQEAHELTLILQAILNKTEQGMTK